MAGIKINEYPLERVTFGDDDFYDVDYFDGATYQSAKIKGSVIKAGIQAGIVSVNVYNTDGVVTGDRTIDADGNGIVESNLKGRAFIVTPPVSPPLVQDAFKILVDPTNLETADGALFVVVDSTSSIRKFAVLEGDRVQINEEYNLPLTDGSDGQALITNGSGQTSFTYYNREDLRGIEAINDIISANLTSNVDNWSPTGYETANLIRITPDANNWEISGFPAPPVGLNRVICFANMHPTFDIRFMHDSSSTATNGFRLRDSGDKVIKGNECAEFWYDHIEQRWYVKNRVG